MPHDAITLSTFSTCASSIARSPVMGFIPWLASVAPIRARSTQRTEMEHCLKYTSTASVGSPSRTSKFRSRWPMARLRCPVRLSDS